MPRFVSSSSGNWSVPAPIAWMKRSLPARPRKAVLPQPRDHQHVGLAHPVLQTLEIANGDAVDAGIEGRKPLMQLIGCMSETDRELVVGRKHSRSPFEAIACLYCTNHPEADAALPAREVGGNVVAVGRAADGRVVRPRAAAQDPLAVGRSREVGAAVHRDICIVGTRPGQAILPNIAVHVVEAKPVGWKCPRGRRFASKNPSGALTVGARFILLIVIDVRGDALAVAFATYPAAGSTIVRELGGDGRPEMKGSPRARAAGIFPLGFARQPIGPPGDRREAQAKFCRLVPSDVLDGKIDALEERRVRIEVSADLVGVRQYCRRPLGLSDGRCTDKKRRESDMVLRTFIALSLRLIDRRAHPESCPRDGDHITPASGTEYLSECRGGIFFQRVPDPVRTDGCDVESNSPQRRF